MSQENTDSTLITAEELMGRHARTFLPCDACWEVFERMRREAGVGGFTAWWCHHSGVRIGWNAVSVVLELCTSLAHFERINAGYKQFVAQLTAAAHVGAQATKGETN